MDPQSLAFVESLYAEYVRDPASVPSDWRRFFESADGETAPRWRPGPSFRPFSVFNPPGGREYRPVVEVARLQDRLNQLVRNYRARPYDRAPRGSPTR